MKHRLRNGLHFPHAADDLAGDDLGADLDAGGAGLVDLAVPDDDAGGVADLHGVHHVVKQVRSGDDLAVLDSQDFRPDWSVKIAAGVFRSEEHTSELQS